MAERTEGLTPTVDVPQLITALSGLLLGIAGLFATRGANRREAERKTAADRLEKRDAEHQRDRDLLTDTQKLLADTRAEVDLAREARDDERREKQRAREALVEEQTARQLEQHQADAAQRRLRSDIAALQAIVTDEFARAAARTAYPPEETA